jgi:amino-acid N-acetyltransferase
VTVAPVLLRSRELPVTARGVWQPAPAITLRTATPEDAPAIQALVTKREAEARLLPRRTNEIAACARRFVVAIRGTAVVACGDLTPLGPRVAEVRSLVVEPDARALGVGDRVLETLAVRAHADGFNTLCAFTHAPAWFIHRGFSIVPHTWVPEKLAATCRDCSMFRRCDQVAVIRPLGVAPRRTGETRS